MRDLFIKQLEATKTELRGMYEALAYMLESTKKALETYDYELAKDVIQSDLAIDHYQASIESSCFSLLLRQQPVAKDLIFIENTIKIVKDNERIGDYCSNVCESLLEIKNIPDSITKELVNMINEEIWMLQQIQAMSDQVDTAVLDTIIKNDDIIDEDYNQVKELAIHYLKGQEDVVADSILMGRALERLGDHLVNIAISLKA